MNRYLVLITVTDIAAPVVYAKSFGEMMQVHSVIKARNLDSAYTQYLASGAKFGRAQIQRA